jgi:hypothetical protein
VSALASNEALCAKCSSAFDRKSLQPVRSGSNGAFYTFTYMCPPCAWSTDKQSNEATAFGAVLLLVLGLLVTQLLVAVSGPFVFLYYWTTGVCS